MKLAASTLGCPDWGFEKILSEYSKIGIEGIEIRGLEGETDADKIERFAPENAENTLNKLKEKNLKLVGFGTSCSFHDPEKYLENISQGKKSIDVCERMGIPFIRVFGNSFPPERNKEAVISDVVSGLSELCEYGKEKGVNVYLEIHGDFNTTETVSPILCQMKSNPNFGILWDIEHSDRAYGDNVLPFYRLISPYVRHVHVKDYMRAKDGKPFELCLVGKGEIPVPTLLGWLKSDGYDGYLSFEWEKKWVPSLPEPEVAFPDYVAYIREVLAKL